MMGYLLPFVFFDVVSPEELIVREAGLPTIALVGIGAAVAAVVAVAVILIVRALRKPK